MNITLVLDHKFPSLNEYTSQNRNNRYAGGKMKKTETDYVALMSTIQKIHKFKSPVKIHFFWIEKNKRRDLDNVAFAKKFILDGLVKAGVLKNDNHKHVIGFTDSFDYGDKYSVIVRIEEK